MNRLAVRPRPLADEGLPGYATRLAMLNGWRSGDRLLGGLGVKARLQNPARHDAITTALADATGHRDEVNPQRFRPDGDRAFAWDENRSIRNLTLTPPRICPACRDESECIPAHWQHLPFTHCRMHHEPLRSACPGCGEPFAWVSELFGPGCPACKVRWRAMRTGCCTSTPDYLSHFSTLGNTAQKKAFLRDLSRAAMRAIRPHDELIDVSEHPPEVADWSQVLARAYAMLADQAFASRWEQSCEANRREVRRLGTSAVTAPVTTLTEGLEQTWPLTASRPANDSTPPTDDLTPFALSAKPARTSNVTNDDQIDVLLRYQTDLQGLARTVGCKTSTARTLVEAGLIGTTNSSRLRRDALFDLRTISGSLPEMTPSVHSGWPMRSYDAARALFAVSEGELLAAILKGELKPDGLATQGDSLTQYLLLSPRPMLRFLHRRLREKLRCPSIMLSSKTTRRVFAISPRELRVWIRAGHLEPQSDPPGFAAFAGGEIRGLLSHYWVLPRYAALRKLSRAALERELRENGIYPVAGRSLYRRTPSLARALRCAPAYAA